MKKKIKFGGILINLLIAAVISLIVNFSYLVMVAMSYGGTASMESKRYVWTAENGLSIVIVEVMFYLTLAFILLTVMTLRMNGEKINNGSYWKRLLICVGVAAAMYFLTPFVRRSTGEISILMMGKRLFSPMALLKISFTVVVAALYGKIYELLYLKQKITIENERLLTENLQSRYDVLVTQINPHFFFNSLNSLAMLVREDKKEGALEYIDRLSDTFRYIIETGQRNMTTLGDELEFTKAYKYLFEVRYAGKLFIDIDVDGTYLERLLPSLSLQPLIENAVKHNTITRNNPLRIRISTENDYLVVSNEISPKIADDRACTGIGLRNLSNRYMLLTGKDIGSGEESGKFVVRLPL